jgi:hypothetical protein
MFFFMVVAELVRIKESTAPVLALAFETIFHQVGRLDVGAFSIFVEWYV